MNPVLRLILRAKERRLSFLELVGLVSLAVTLVASVSLILGLAAVASFRQQNAEFVGKRD